MKLDVYALGSALIDIQVNIEDSLLAQLGIEKGNMYLTDPQRQQEVLQRLIAAGLNTAAGGSAANTIYGIAHLGGTAGLCGKVADDAFGRRYAESMRESGALFSGHSMEGVTGSCVVLVSADAQRTMLTHLGVSSEITPEDIDGDLLRGSSYLYLEGYLLDSPVATGTMRRAITLAREAGVRIALTASDAFCVQRHQENLMQLLQGSVDLLFANAHEARALTGTDTSDDAIRVLTGMGPGVALTDGDRGSILSIGGETVRIDPVAVTARDTTGAGDSYAAGLLYGLTHGYPLAVCGRLASFYASRVVSMLGPRCSEDVRSRVADLLSS